MHPQPGREGLEPTGAGRLLRVHPEAVTTLLEIFDGHYDVNVRWNAAEALGTIGDLRAIPILHKHVNDEESRIFQGAVEALAQLGDEGRKLVSEIAASTPTDWRADLRQKIAITALSAPQARHKANSDF